MELGVTACGHARARSQDRIGLEYAPTERAAVRRPVRRGPHLPGVHGAGIQQRADVLVTSRGRLSCGPLLAILLRDLAAGAATPWRCHAGIDIVCVMLAGKLLYEPLHDAPLLLGSEDVAVISTGARLDYRWRAVGEQPVRALMFWLPAAGAQATRVVHRREHRAERIAALTPIAGAGTAVPTSAHVTIRAGVLPVDTRILHDAGDRHSYIVSTLGAISIDGVHAGCGDGVLSYAPHTIRALESTEVFVVEI